MAKNCVAHAIVILITGVVICSGNVKFQKVIVAESSTTFGNFSDIKVHKAVAECVKRCQKRYEHDQLKMEICIKLDCIAFECIKHYPLDKEKIVACIDELRVHYYKK
ncbi:uncharacterized protein DS421_3g84200 [Arachis hypogaea]|nr:uncharacterized protein DS421_3g84200 [Arachis hypogaea]